MSFELGQKYSRREIHDLLGAGGIRSYLPSKNGRIVCGCFDLKKNQLAPEVVDFAEAPKVVAEAQRAAADRAVIPVFIRRANRAWEYVGRYRVDRLSTDPADLRDPRFRKDAVGILYLSALEDLSARLEPGHRTWIFQGNPDTFRLDEYLRRTRSIRWTVRQERLAPCMNVGDRVYLWRAAGKSGAVSGVIASGHITRAPLLEEEDPTDRDLWIDFPKGKALRVQVEIDRVASVRQVIKKDWLKQDPVLSDLRILTVRAGTNFPTTPAQAERLNALWSRTGVDWSEEESLAGLWAYARTRDGEVSQLPGSPVAAVALRIGRAVSGVYNKVMNFRSLDPGKPGGLPGVSDADRAVWDRYFNSAARTLDIAHLEHDYASLWPEEATGPAPNPESPPERGTTVRGQGYEPDPAVRLAVEWHAMDLAQSAYRDEGFEVEVTADRHPFDLRCTRDGLEVRVEVKGTRGDGGSVEVTIGEVLNARGTAWRTDLYVVSQIRVEPGSPPQASGGSVLRIEAWCPGETELSPTRYRFAVPSRD